MKVTFLMPADDLTGGNRVVACYARFFLQRGHDVCVVSQGHARPNWQEIIRLIRRGQWRKLILRYRPLPGHIASSGVPHRELKKARPIEAKDLPDADVLIATWWETAVWMHRMPLSKGRPVHLIQGYEIWFDPSRRFAVHDALKLPNQKIAISHNLKQTIEDELGPLNIKVVPNAVDLSQFNAPARERNKVPRVGFIYAQAAIKGTDICIHACMLARKQMPDLQVLAFGVDDVLSSLPLPDQTHYVQRPEQDELSSLYSQCDAWLFGSRLDSFGLPILEAMASRTPVIGVPIGAAPELLAEGGGFLVPPESPKAMADTLVEFFSQSPSYWKMKSDAAYERARAYSWDDAADLFLSQLERSHASA